MTTRRHGDVLTPPNLSLTPCRPLTPSVLCATCRRHSPGLPHDPHFRPHTVAIDATVVMRGGVCPMHEARPVERHWQDERESALEAA